MKYLIVTTCNEDGYKKYGDRMLETFDNHWPKDVEICMYYEGKKLPKNRFSDRVKIIDLLEACPELNEFKERWKNDPVANGMPDANGLPNGLRRRGLVKDKWQQGKVYLWDAVRFSHKVFCQIHAAQTSDADVLYWFDADCITFRDIPESVFKSWTPPDVYISYLGRNSYTECGYIGYNLNHSQSQAFMKKWKKMYTKDKIFKLKQWTDCHTFDHVREQMEEQGLIVNNNLNKDNDIKGHPFVNSVLGDYIDHLKGNRKQGGKSWTRIDLQVDKSGIEYWDR